MLNLSKYVGFNCKLRNGYLATIERNPDWDGYGDYEFLVKYDLGRSWTVTRTGYVWNTKSPHDFDVCYIIDAEESEDTQILIGSGSNLESKHSIKPPKKKRNRNPLKIAYYDYSAYELCFTSKLPVGIPLEIIGTDCTMRESQMLLNLYHIKKEIE